MTKNAYSFLNQVDIQLILYFKNSFGKYHPVFPKSPQEGFWDTLYIIHISIYPIK